MHGARQALVRALHSGHLGGAAVDVSDPEPLPADDPLWDCPNILVSPHGKYIALDFGIMGTLTEVDKNYLAQNFLAFFNRDYKRVAQAHLDAGWVPPGTRVDELEAVVAELDDVAGQALEREVLVERADAQVFGREHDVGIELVGDSAGIGHGDQLGADHLVVVERHPAARLQPAGRGLADVVEKRSHRQMFDFLFAHVQRFGEYHRQHCDVQCLSHRLCHLRNHSMNISYGTNVRYFPHKPSARQIEKLGAWVTTVGLNLVRSQFRRWRVERNARARLATPIETRDELVAWFAAGAGAVVAAESCFAGAVAGADSAGGCRPRCSYARGVACLPFGVRMRKPSCRRRRRQARSRRWTSSPSTIPSTASSPSSARST